MAYDIGPRISIEGEAEYKRALQGIILEQKKLSSELELMESAFAGQLNSMEALTAKSDILQKQYDAENERLELLVKQLGAAEEAKRRTAAAGEVLTDSIAAQKAVIADFEKALEGSANSTLELRDANGNLIRTIEDGAGEVSRLKAELKDMERALSSNAREQQSTANAANNYERQVNESRVRLNEFDNELQQNKRYMDEAANSTDRCATSVDRYGKETKEAESATGNASKKSSGFFSTLKSGVGVIAGVAGVMTGLAKKTYDLVKSFADMADELKRSASETGLSTDKLQEMQYVGDGVGAGVDTISAAMKRLVNNMGMAKTGTGEAYDAFEALGVSFRDNITGELRNSTEVFNEIIDALGRMANETERDALAQDLLGRSATELNPLIEAGSAAMNDLAKEAHDAGAVMSKDTVDALDEAGDRIDHFWQTVKAKVGEAIVSVGQWLAGGKKATFDDIDALESLGEQMDAIKNAYDSASTTAEIALKKQIGLWDDLSGTVEKTFGELKTAVVSQMQWYENYTTNLANLSMRNIAGVDELVLKLSDGTKESAATVAGLASASDEQIMHLLGNMNEVEDRRANLARYMGQLKTDANEQLNALYAGMGDSAKQLDASETARKAGESTIYGYITGLCSKKQEVVDAYKDIADSAFFEGVIKPWKISSPSKVMQDATEHIWDGMILQTRQARDDVLRSFEETFTATERAARQVDRPVYQEPPRDTGAQTAAMIGDTISKALSGVPGSSGKVFNFTFNITEEIDGRQLTRATRQYRIEEDGLYGENILE